jgi:hypothetical protein
MGYAYPAQERCERKQPDGQDFASGCSGYDVLVGAVCPKRDGNIAAKRRSGCMEFSAEVK